MSGLTLDGRPTTRSACLTAVRTSAAQCASITAQARSITTAGSPEKLRPRAPMTGLAGSLT